VNPEAKSKEAKYLLRILAVMGGDYFFWVRSLLDELTSLRGVKVPNKFELNRVYSRRMRFESKEYPFYPPPDSLEVEESNTDISISPTFLHYCYNCGAETYQAYFRHERRKTSSQLEDNSEALEVLYCTCCQRFGTDFGLFVFEQYTRYLDFGVTLHILANFVKEVLPRMIKTLSKEKIMFPIGRGLSASLTKGEEKVGKFLLKRYKREPSYSEIKKAESILKGRRIKL